MIYHTSFVDSICTRYTISKLKRSVTGKQDGALINFYKYFCSNGVIKIIFTLNQTIESGNLVRNLKVLTSTMHQNLKWRFY